MGFCILECSWNLFPIQVSLGKFFMLPPPFMKHLMSFLFFTANCERLQAIEIVAAIDKSGQSISTISHHSAALFFQITILSAVMFISHLNHLNIAFMVHQKSPHSAPMASNDAAFLCHKDMHLPLLWNLSGPCPIDVPCSLYI